MIWLMGYTVIETAVLFAGCGLAFNLAIDSQKLNEPLVAGSAIAGLVVGLFFAWLMRRFFEKAPAMGWVWAYTFLAGWVIGGGVFYLTVADPNRPVVLVAMSCCLGTLPGLVMGWLLARAHPALLVKAPPEPEPTFGTAIFGQPALVTALAPASMPAPMLAPGRTAMPALPAAFNPAALKKRLQDEVRQLEAAHPSANAEVIDLAPDRQAVVFALVNYLGRLKFYIVCGLDYPAGPPEAVFLEFEPAGQPGNPVKVDYQGQAIDTWQAGYDLETIVKDAALQVEENMIS